MTDLSFEAALNERVSDMLEACVKCGKCVEVCPSVAPANIADAASVDVITGVIDLIRSGEGSEVPQMGVLLHTERPVHQGVRLRRQPALPARHGARRDAAK